jgi:hypothetical protein
VDEKAQLLELAKVIGRDVRKLVSIVSYAAIGRTV